MSAIRSGPLGWAVICRDGDVHQYYQEDGSPGALAVYPSGTDADVARAFIDGSDTGETCRPHRVGGLVCRDAKEGG